MYEFVSFEKRSNLENWFNDNDECFEVGRNVVRKVRTNSELTKLSTVTVESSPPSWGDDGIGEGVGEGGWTKGRDGKCPSQDHPLCSARELSKIWSEKVCANFDIHLKKKAFSSLYMGYLYMCLRTYSPQT